MKLVDYLDQKGETEQEFADRSGTSQTTVNRVCLGGGCNIATASKICQSTGGSVRLEDLVPAGVTG